MGRPYLKELAALRDTYDWAAQISVEPLTTFVRDASNRALVAVGSGGSATAAHLAAMLHRERAAAFARYATPLDMILSQRQLADASVLLLSASGRNRDIVAALDWSIRNDAASIATICTRTGSPLADEARRHRRAHVLDVDTPNGKDGFLATNSLLATCVFLARGYGCELPAFWDEETPSIPKGVRQRTMGMVLHGGWGSPVATDLESKLNESGIAAAQISDYRNFAHGRHLWLARRGEETFVIMVVTPETSVIADRTRALIPRSIPVVELRTSVEGVVGMLELLIKGFRVVGSLGELQDFDPGRPSVPTFGRQLYHLAFTPPARTEPLAVTRKLRQTRRLGDASHRIVAEALSAFVGRLSAARIGGVVLDYDGTLCGPAERFGKLRQDLGSECSRLLKAGIKLGIATGRGRSVRLALQQALPRQTWDGVVIGYYNGGVIAPLTDDDSPNRDLAPIPSLADAYEQLRVDPIVQACSNIVARRSQITLEPSRALSADALLAHVMTVLSPLEPHGIHVLRSSHSVDILPADVTKKAVIRAVAANVSQEAEVLCIGDRGAWPGNDAALLSHWPSLSVDDVSASLSTCWNLAPEQLSGPDATLYYLKALHAARGVGRLRGKLLDQQ